MGKSNGFHWTTFYQLFHHLYVSQHLTAKSSLLPPPPYQFPQKCFRVWAQWTYFGLRTPYPFLQGEVWRTFLVWGPGYYLRKSNLKKVGVILYPDNSTEANILFFPHQILNYISSIWVHTRSWLCSVNLGGRNIAIVTEL